MATKKQIKSSIRTKSTKESVENELITVHPSRFGHIKWYILSMFFIGVWIIVWFDMLGMNFLLTAIDKYMLYSFVSLGGGILILIYTELLTLKEKYVFTNYRVIHSQGLFGTHESTIEYEMISHYTLRQTSLEKLLNIGTVEINIIGRGIDSKFYLKKIPKINKVKKILKERIFATGKSKFL